MAYLFKFYISYISPRGSWAVPDEILAEHISSSQPEPFTQPSEKAEQYLLTTDFARPSFLKSLGGTIHELLVMRRAAPQMLTKRFNLILILHEISTQSTKNFRLPFCWPQRMTAS